MGRLDGPGSAGFGAEASRYSGGGNQGNDNNDRPSDNITTSPRVGRQDGPGSITEGNQVSGLDALVDQINKDIQSGVNVGGDNYQNQMAQGILSGAFGDTRGFGIEVPETSIADKLLSATGYDTDQTFGQNVYDMAVPGQNTPLGAFSALPPVMGANKALSGIISLGNAIAGKFGFGKGTSDTGGITSGMGIAEKYLDQTPQPFTGRPDDAPGNQTTFTPNTVSPSGFTRVSANIPTIPPNPATETREEADARIAGMYGEDYINNRERMIDQALFDKYLENQSDVGVFTPPDSDPKLDYMTQLETYIGSDPKQSLPQRFGGYADPLRGEDTLRDLLEDKITASALKDLRTENRLLQQDMNRVRSDLEGVPNAFQTLSPRSVARKNLLSGRPFQEI